MPNEDFTPQNFNRFTNPWDTSLFDPNPAHWHFTFQSQFPTHQGPWHEKWYILRCIIMTHLRTMTLVIYNMFGQLQKHQVFLDNVWLRYFIEIIEHGSISKSTFYVNTIRKLKQDHSDSMSKQQDTWFCQICDWYNLETYHCMTHFFHFPLLECRWWSSSSRMLWSQCRGSAWAWIWQMPRRPSQRRSAYWMPPWSLWTWPGFPCRWWFPQSWPWHSGVLISIFSFFSFCSFWVFPTSALQHLLNHLHLSRTNSSIEVVHHLYPSQTHSSMEVGLVLNLMRCHPSPFGSQEVFLTQKPCAAGKDPLSQ